MRRLSVLIRSALRVHSACTPLPRSHSVANANRRYPCFESRATYRYYNGSSSTRAFALAACSLPSCAVFNIAYAEGSRDADNLSNNANRGVASRLREKSEEVFRILGHMYANGRLEVASGLVCAKVCVYAAASVPAHALGPKHAKALQHLRLFIQRNFVLSLDGVRNGRWHLFLTCLVMHADKNHLFLNCLMSFVTFGMWPPGISIWQLCALFVSGGIFSSIADMWAVKFTNAPSWTSFVGSSGSVYTMMGYSIVTRLDSSTYFTFAKLAAAYVTVRASWGALRDLRNGVCFSADNVDHVGHLSGLIWGVAMGLIFKGQDSHHYTDRDDGGDGGDGGDDSGNDSGYDDGDKDFDDTDNDWDDDGDNGGYDEGDVDAVGDAASDDGSDDDVADEGDAEVDVNVHHGYDTDRYIVNVL